MIDKTLYVVSGFMRTGTSMIMRALHLGGLVPVMKKSRDVMKNKFSDEHYDPNVGGLYELEPQDYKSFGFPKQFEGKLIKALNYGVPRMSVMEHGIRVIFMMRDPEEIRQSYLAFFGVQLTNIAQYKRNMSDIIERIRNRKDVLSLSIFQYRDVVSNPVQHFQILKDVGWPIDPCKSASVVNPELCRFKVENLTVGII
jgi:hypothetical protein